MSHQCHARGTRLWNSSIASSFICSFHLLTWNSWFEGWTAWLFRAWNLWKQIKVRIILQIYCILLWLKYIYVCVPVQNDRQLTKRWQALKWCNPSAEQNSSLERLTIAADLYILCDECQLFLKLKMTFWKESFTFNSKHKPSSICAPAPGQMILPTWRQNDSSAREPESCSNQLHIARRPI